MRSPGPHVEQAMEDPQALDFIGLPGPLAGLLKAPRPGATFV
jgi:hypothetical protein